MSYVHSSPWQDAANFGGAIGDRLTEALINLPLKKAQMAQELLANAAQLKQRGFQNEIETQRLGLEQKRVGVEAKNAETRKESAFSKGLGDIVHNHQAGEKQQETVRHNKAMEQTAGERIAMEHLGKGDRALETERHPEFGGRTVKEMMTLLDRNPAEQPDIPPEQVKAFHDYVAHIKQGAAQEQQQDAGVQIPTRESGTPGLGDAAIITPQSTSQIIKPNSPEYNALSPGSTFQGVDGKMYKKQGQPSVQQNPLSDLRPQGLTEQPAITKEAFHTEMSKLSPHQQQSALDAIQTELSKKLDVQLEQIGSSVFNRSQVSSYNRQMQRNPAAMQKQLDSLHPQEVNEIYMKALQTGKQAFK